MLAGQAPAGFGAATLHELLVILGAASRRDARQAWLGAVYALRAYHTPDDMPDDPALPFAPGEDQGTDGGVDAGAAYVQAFFTALSGGPDGH